MRRLRTHHSAWQRHRLTLVLLLAGAAFAGGCGSSPAPARGDGAADSADAKPVVAAPDLRFKWVAAGFALRIHEFTNGGTGGGSVTTRGPLGATPLDLAGETVTDYVLFSTSVNLEPMVALAASGPLATLEADVATFSTASSIVVSLDSSPDPGSIYQSTWNGTQSAAVSYLPFVHAPVAVADFPAWVASEGASGRVVTALCPKDGALYATSFGRTGDTTSYQTQVVTTALPGLEAALTALASGGYFITALGRDGTGVNGAGGFVLVGTRAPGATAERSIKLVDVTCMPGAMNDPPAEIQHLFDAGYALVGEIFHGSGPCDGSPTWALIGEK
jgi:hypothetical protein